MKKKTRFESKTVKYKGKTYVSRVGQGYCLAKSSGEKCAFIDLFDLCVARPRRMSCCLNDPQYIIWKEKK